MIRPRGTLFFPSQKRTHFMAQTNSQWLASYSLRDPICLSMNARIVPSSSCVEGKPAVKPCSYRSSPSYILSRPRTSLTPHSCVPLYLSLIACLTSNASSSVISLWGVTSPTVTLGGGVSSYLVMQLGCNGPLLVCNTKKT